MATRNGKVTGNPLLSLVTEDGKQAEREIMQFARTGSASALSLGVALSNFKRRDMHKLFGFKTFDLWLAAKVPSVSRATALRFIQVANAYVLDGKGNVKITVEEFDDLVTIGTTKLATRASAASKPDADMGAIIGELGEMSMTQLLDIKRPAAPVLSAEVKAIVDALNKASKDITGGADAKLTVKSLLAQLTKKVAALPQTKAA